MTSTKILFWNCRGVTRRRLELLQLVQEKEIDILLLNETHLSHNQKIKLPNFITYVSNRPQQAGHPAAGGTAILIHRKFIHHHISITTNSVENTIVELQLGTFETRLVAIYKRPTVPLLTSDLENLLDTRINVIIAGDLNAKHLAWSSRYKNPAGNAIIQLLSTRNDTTFAAPTSPTHYPDNTSPSRYHRHRTYENRLSHVPSRKPNLRAIVGSHPDHY